MNGKVKTNFLIHNFCVSGMKTKPYMYVIIHTGVTSHKAFNLCLSCNFCSLINRVEWRENYESENENEIL